jgi:hypothetical protein
VLLREENRSFLFILDEISAGQIFAANLSPTVGSRRKSGVIGKLFKELIVGYNLSLRRRSSSASTSEANFFAADPLGKSFDGGHLDQQHSLTPCALLAMRLFLL